MQEDFWSYNKKSFSVTAALGFLASAAASAGMAWLRRQQGNNLDTAFIVTVRPQISLFPVQTPFTRCSMDMYILIISRTSHWAAQNTTSHNLKSEILQNPSRRVYVKLSGYLQSEEPLIVIDDQGNRVEVLVKEDAVRYGSYWTGRDFKDAHRAVLYRSFADAPQIGFKRKDIPIKPHGSPTEPNTQEKSTTRDFSSSSVTSKPMEQFVSRVETPKLLISPLCLGMMNATSITKRETKRFGSNWFSGLYSYYSLSWEDFTARQVSVVRNNSYAFAAMDASLSMDGKDLLLSPTLDPRKATILTTKVESEAVEDLHSSARRYLLLSVTLAAASALSIGIGSWK